MLAVDVPIEQIRFPVIASPKVDGIRAMVIKGKLVSRKLIPIPNDYTRKLFSRPEYEGLDGELIVGKPYDKDVFSKTSGAMRRKSGEPDVTFYVFDDIDLPTRPYEVRLGTAEGTAQDLMHTKPLPAQYIHDAKQLKAYEDRHLALGYEGVITRDPEGKYKYGRSTVNEQGMCKIKRFVDGEAVILKVNEEMKNNNPAKKDNLGHTKRSTHKANMVGKGRLGEFEVRDVKSGIEFVVPAGAITHKERERLWKIRDELPGKLLKYKHFPKGRVVKPRNPVFLGFRDKWDVS